MHQLHGRLPTGYYSSSVVVIKVLQQQIFLRRNSTHNFLTHKLLGSNNLWSFNTSSGNWTLRGGDLTVTNAPPNFPDHIGGVGWPDIVIYSAFCQNSQSAFIFGGGSGMCFVLAVLSHVIYLFYARIRYCWIVAI